MTFALQRILTLRTIVHVKKTKIVLTRPDLYVAMENVLFQTYFQLTSVHAKLTIIAMTVTFVVMGNAKSLKNVHARTEKIVQRVRHAVMDNVCLQSPRQLMVVHVKRTKLVLEQT